MKLQEDKTPLGKANVKYGNKKTKKVKNPNLRTIAQKRKPKKPTRRKNGPTDKNYPPPK